jgi:S1-C subfamily serine protease
MLRNPHSLLQVFMVELTRGWNSRLGFSLQSEGNRTVISVVHPDSVAAKDGRLKQGDVLLMVSQIYFLPISSFRNKT